MRTFPHHRSGSSYRRHGALASYERIHPHASGVLSDGHAIPVGHIPHALQELIEWIEAWVEQFRRLLLVIDRGITGAACWTVLFQKLDLVPARTVEPTVPVVLEDEDDLDWENFGQNTLKETPGARFIVFSNHARRTSASPELRNHLRVSIDTKKPWIPLQCQIRILIPDPEPVLDRLRRQRIETLTPRERKIQLMLRDGLGDREINRILRLHGDRLSRILKGMAQKLGVHESEIREFETH